MEKLKLFLKRKDVVISAKRYGIDALGAMAQGLFCSLLIGTIIGSLTATDSLYKPQTLIKTGFQSYFFVNLLSVLCSYL